MKVFIVLVVSLDIRKLPALGASWQKKKWFLEIPSFNMVMPVDRFNQIWQYSHFYSKADAPQDSDPDRDTGKPYTV